MNTGEPTATDAPAVSWRVLWYPRALAAACVVAFVVFLAAADGSDAVSGRVGGDYPAFYSAGQLVIDDPDALYDIDAQRIAQEDLFGESTSDEGFLPFAYPPYVALLYAPLAQLPYKLSYALDTALMVGLVVFALHRVRPLVPLLDRYFEQAVYASLFFFPMFRAVTAGQTTAVVLALLAIGFRALHDRQDWVAGFAFAGLLYKPQYALPLLGVCLLIGRWRAVVAGMVGAVALYAVGVVAMGGAWLSEWIDFARWFTEVDAENNGQNAVSYLGLAEALWGVGEPIALAVGWSLALATAALLAWCWWRDGGQHLDRLLAVTCPAILLIAPHAMYYDAGLLVLSFAVLVGVPPRDGRLLVALYVVAMLQPLAADLGWAPTFAVVVATFVWAVRPLVAVPARRSSLGLGVP